MSIKFYCIALNRKKFKTIYKAKVFLRVFMYLARKTHTRVYSLETCWPTCLACCWVLYCS